MKKRILKMTTAFIPLSVGCWLVEEPRAAVLVLAIGLIAAAELIYQWRQY